MRSFGISIDYRWIRLRARSRGGRVAESVVACNVLNQMTELGRPESIQLLVGDLPLGWDR